MKKSYRPLFAVRCSTLFPTNNALFRERVDILGICCVWKAFPKKPWPVLTLHLSVCRFSTCVVCLRACIEEFVPSLHCCIFWFCGSTSWELRFVWSLGIRRLFGGMKLHREMGMVVTVRRIFYIADSAVTTLQKKKGWRRECA